MFSVSPSVIIPDEELLFTFVRSSGPGGQNVNKVNSKAVLRWNVTQSSGLPEAVRQRFLAKYASRLTTEGEIIIGSQRYRDQGRNIDDCLEKLRELLVPVLHAPVKRKKTRPTKASRERRHEEKRKQSGKKQGRSWKGGE